MSRTNLRLIGGAILLFNLYLIGAYNMSGLPVLLLTFGLAGFYEFIIVRTAAPEQAQQDKPPEDK